MAKLSLSKKAVILSVICVAMAISAPAQTFTSLHSFDQPGYNPISGLIQASDGDLYGTTLVGGSSQNGAVFKITPAGTFTTLYSFCPDAAHCFGTQPAVGLIQASDGNFYGTTRAGGTGSYGIVFQLTPAGVLTTLHNFDGTDGNGSSALIEASDGNFYGATVAGGTSPNCGNFGCGTVFRVSPGGTLTSLYSFCASQPCPDGKWPNGLIQANDGNLYGTTGAGGAHGGGTVFRISSAGTLTTLYSFCSEVNCADGSGPKAGLLQATDGNFYGTTEAGGTSTKCGTFGCGTIFQMTSAGTLTTLHNFCALAGCADGRAPSAPLIQATDGNFYGTTMQGGNSANCNLRCGTVFEITPRGTLATLQNFNSTNGADPTAALVQASDGRFFGTTEAGGTYGGGTIFRLAVVPAVRFSTTALGFGNQALNEASTPRTVTITNSGTSVLAIQNVAITGNFAISANACIGAELIPLANCKISLIFTPTVLGKQTGTLTLTDNAADNPQTMLLSGTGVEPATLLPATAYYGNQAVGTVSAPKTLTLTNNQTFALTNISISVTGDFLVSATTCGSTLAAKSKCTINVTFSPAVKGLRKGALRVSDSASNSPQASSLQGTGN